MERETGTGKEKKERFGRKDISGKEVYVIEGVWR